jgi:hypothetical protein
MDFSAGGAGGQVAAHPGGALAGEARRELLICLTVDASPEQASQRAFLVNERTHTMFSSDAIERNKVTRNLIDQVFNAGLIALVGCSIVAALAIGARMSAMQAATPTSEWPLLLDQGAARDPCYEPRMQRLFNTVSAPAGQGWG